MELHGTILNLCLEAVSAVFCQDSTDAQTMHARHLRQCGMCPGC